MGELYRRVDACRSCGSQHLTEVLDLGNLAISDFLGKGEEPDRAPLTIVRCEACTLVQTAHTVAPERLFRRYWYRSGTNERMVAALRDVVADVSERVTLDVGDKVLDIGANDGTLLRNYPAHVLRYAVEPARTFRDDLMGHADVVYHGLFPDKQPPEGLFKAITSIAMFYAVDEPHAFVEAIKGLLHPEGVWTVQLQDLASVLRDNAFDYFCHEHLALYSLHSFERLIHEHGLEIADWSTNQVNGGSLRVHVMHGDKIHAHARPEDEGFAWQGFGRNVRQGRAETMAFLEQLRSQGKKVLGYAASTKSGTLCQYYGIGPEILPAFAERAPEKVGLRTVTGIPIISEEEARAQRPDFYFAGAWQFVQAFIRRETVPFISPLPQLSLHTDSAQITRPVATAAA